MRKRGASMFSKRLRNLRENKGMKQEELGDMLGLSASTIGMYEQGRRQADNETLIKIADFFDVSIDYLLGKTEVKKYEQPYENKLEEVLFSKAKELSEEEKKTVLSVINAIKKDIDNENR